MEAKNLKNNEKWAKLMKFGGKNWKKCIFWMFDFSHFSDIFCEDSFFQFWLRLDPFFIKKSRFRTHQQEKIFTKVIIINIPFLDDDQFPFAFAAAFASLIIFSLGFSWGKFKKNMIFFWKKVWIWWNFIHFHTFFHSFNFYKNCIFDFKKS